MKRVESGEIAHIGRLIDESVAVDIGSSVLALYAEYCRHSYVNMLNEGTFNISNEPSGHDKSEIKNMYTNAVTLSNEYFDIYSKLKEEVTCISEDLFKDDKSSIGADIFFGRAAGGRWHIDGSRDYRLLVNISEFPISLLVASDWSNTELGKSWDTIIDYDDEAPKEFKTITYNPGEAVALNNYCSREKQTPHVGSDEPGKMFIRIFADSFESL